MKREILNFLRLTPCVFTLTACADLTIVQEVTSSNPMMGNTAQEMKVMVSKGRTRIDHAQGGMIMIPGENKNIMLMHSQKAYMLMPQADPNNTAGAQDNTQAAASQDEMKWEKTDKKETIAGYDAEQWIGKDAAGRTAVEVWVGGNPEIIAEYVDSLARSGQGAMAKLMEKMRAGQSEGPYKYGFPLKSITYDENGTAQATTTVKKLDNSPVDPKWFTIPDGYQEMKMPAMGQGGMPSMPESGE